MSHTAIYDAALEVYKIDPPLEFCGQVYETITRTAFEQLQMDGIIKPTWVKKNLGPISVPQKSSL